MAKHTILIALLAALILVVAHASREEEEGQESCRKQIQRLNLKHCEKHLMKRIEQKEGDDDDDDDEDVLIMRGINYIRNRRESKEERQKQKCCTQLSEVNILDCRCQALQKIKERLSDKLQEKEMKDLEIELRTLPLRCGIAPPLGCDLSSDSDD